MNRFLGCAVALAVLVGCQLPMASQMNSPTDKGSSSYVAPPATPTGVSASSGNAQATIGWTAVTGAASYNLYYSTASGVTTSTGTKVKAVTSPYAVTGLTNGTTYYFIVTAVNAGGESPASTQQSATPQVSAAGAPTGVTATSGNTQVTVTWTAASGAISYNLYYSTTSGVTTTSTGSTKVTGVTSPHAVTGLANGTTYYFIVTAVNAGGESPASTQQSATPQVPVAGAPTGVGASAGNAQVALSWTTVTGATSYNLYYSTTSGVTTTNGTKVTGVTSSYTVAGLTNGTTYYFIVTAVNAGGETACPQVSAEPQVPVPTAPTGLAAVAGNAEITLTWASVTGAASYNVYYSTTSGVTIANGTKVSSVTSPHTVMGLTNAAIYYFIVTAVNAAGETACAQVSAAPVAPPAAPTGFAATGGNAQATLTWTAVPGATGYNLYYSTTSGVTPTTGTKVSSVTSGYTLTGLANGVTYYFIVTAFNAGGETQCLQISAVTAPVAPVVTATVGNTQVTLTWVAVTGATSYNVYYSATTGVTTTTYGTKVASVTSPYSLTDLTTAATYYFVVTAVNTGGETACAQVAASTGPVAGVVTTLGTSFTGYVQAVATDGTNVYVAEGNLICKMVIATGVQTTLAGSTSSGASNGIGGAASFNSPAGLATDGTNLYVADQTNNLIRRIVISTGAVTTLAGLPTLQPGNANGTGTLASFNEPWGLATDGTNLYVADAGNQLIRKIVVSSGVVTTLAGSGSIGSLDGIGTAASFWTPAGIATDGTNLYVADANTNLIRKIVISTEAVTTLAGGGTSLNGTGTAASFNWPHGVATDGTFVYVADSENSLIRKIVISSGAVTTLARTQGSPFALGTKAGVPQVFTSDGTNIYEIQ